MRRTKAKFRLFSGNAGWGGGQLENEMGVGGWLTAPASISQVFADPEGALKAQYFVLTVASDNPEKWGDNKIVKQLTIAPPAVK